MNKYVLYFLSLFALSTSPIFTRYSEVSVDSLGFWRLLLAAAFMWPTSLILSRKNNTNRGLMSDSNFIPSPWVGLMPPLAWSVISGTLFFMHLWTYFYAAHHTKVANAVIIYATNPLFISLVAFFAFNERLTRRIAIAYVLAMAGVYFLVAENLTMNPESFWGDMSALISAVFFSLYMATGKMARHHLSNTHFSAIKYSIGALCFLLFALSRNINVLYMTPQAWIAVVGMVLIPTFLGHFVFTYLMNSLNLNFMSCGKLIEPVFSSLLAFWFFQEKISPMTYVAFLLTALGVLVLLWPKQNNRKNT